MSRLDAMELEHDIRRADGQPLTSEDIEAVHTLISVMVDYCEAKGLLLNGYAGPARDTGEEKAGEGGA